MVFPEGDGEDAGGTGAAARRGSPLRGSSSIFCIPGVRAALAALHPRLIKGRRFAALFPPRCALRLCSRFVLFCVFFPIGLIGLIGLIIPIGLIALGFLRERLMGSSLRG